MSSKRKKNKGFTLVELVVAIAILGIVIAIALPTIGNIKKRNEMKKYISYENLIISSAKLYVDSYEDDLFNKNDNNTQCTGITFSELESRNLLKKYDLDGVKCISSESGDIAAYVVKKSSGKYSYYPTIKCQKTDAPGDYLYKTSHTNIPTICKNVDNDKIVKIKSSACISKGSDKLTLDFNTSKYNKNKNYISSLKYSLIEAVNSNKMDLIRNLDYYDINSTNSKTELELNNIDKVKKQGNTNKNYKLVIRYLQDEDYQYEVLNQTIKINYAKPKIKIISKKYDTFQASKLNTYSDYIGDKWTNKNVYVKTEATDSCGNKINVTLPNGTSNKKIEMKIEKEGEQELQFKTSGYGNENNLIAAASLIVKIDKTAPTVPKVTLKKWANDKAPTQLNYQSLESYNNDSWSNKSVYTIASATDTGSSKNPNDIIYSYTTTGATKNSKDAKGNQRSIQAEGTSKIKYKACDIAGNCSKYTSEYIVKIDTTPPDCNVTGGSTEWINKDSKKPYREITATCSDSGSGCITKPFKKRYKDNIETTTAGAKGNNDGGTVEDRAGNVGTCLANQTVRIDRIAPTCKSSGGSSDWTNKDVVIVGTCSDEGGSKCKQAKITKTFSKEGISVLQSPGKVEDKAGNKKKCPSTQTIKIDKTPPDCNVTGGNTKWINANSIIKSRIIKARCFDSGSGCDKSTESFSTKYSDDIETTTAGAKGNNNGGIVKDNAGNETECSANQTVRIDKTLPTCNVTGGNTAWINKKSKPTSRTITATCSDSGSGCATKPFSKTYSNDINTTTAGAKGNNNGGTVEDRAKNKGKCRANQTVRIDKTSPTVPKVTLKKWANNDTSPLPTNYTSLESYSNDSWSNKKVYTIAYATDTGSSKNPNDITYSYTTTGATKNSKDAKGNQKSIEKDGISKIKYKACDIAGNCSETSEYIVKIDTIKPTCISSGGNTNWTNKNVTIKGTCEDSGSGCGEQGTITKTFTTDTNSSVSPGIVYDKAKNPSDLCPEQTVMIDKTAPTVPTVVLKKWANDTRPSTTNYRSLDNYSNDSWSNKKVYTIAGSSTDKGSGEVQYYYTTTGATRNEVEINNQSRSIEANGTSKIKYRACDKVGNCSDYTSEYIVKIDKTSPTIIKIFNPGKNTVTTKPFSLGLHGKDNSDGSGIAEWHYSYDKILWTAYANSNSENFITPQFSTSKDVYIRLCDHVGNCSSSEKATINIVDECSSTREECGNYGSCQGSCGTGTQYSTCQLKSTYTGANCGPSYKKSRSCDTGKSCVPSNPCGEGSTTLFGTSKDSHPGNSATSPTDASNWTPYNWCNVSEDRWCHASEGYARICIADWCKGKTAIYINNTYGCNYSQYWCTC